MDDEWLIFTITKLNESLLFMFNYDCMHYDLIFHSTLIFLGRGREARAFNKFAVVLDFLFSFIRRLPKREAGSNKFQRPSMQDPSIPLAVWTLLLLQQIFQISKISHI